MKAREKLRLGNKFLINSVDTGTYGEGFWDAIQHVDRLFYITKKKKGVGDKP